MSNPFNFLFPVPKEGFGLNPILQDPALAIHPPILYLGYVGSSIIFSSSLAALVQKNINSDWAKHIKNGFLLHGFFNFGNYAWCYLGILRTRLGEDFGFGILLKMYHLCHGYV